MPVANKLYLRRRATKVFVVFIWSIQIRGFGRFRVQVSGFRVQGSGFRVQGSGFRVQGLMFRV
jgi:hypothetical protein